MIASRKEFAKFQRNRTLADWHCLTRGDIAWAAGISTCCSKAASLPRVDRNRQGTAPSIRIASATMPGGSRQAAPESDTKVAERVHPSFDC